MIFAVSFLGMPLVSLLVVALLGIGAFNLARYAENTYRQKKRDNAHRKDVENKIEAAVDYGASVYNHLKDPVTREAAIRDVADEVYITLKAGDIVLADQFKSRTKVVLEQEPAKS